MDYVTVSFSLADTVNAVQLNVQRYRAAQMVQASEVGRLITLPHFDWTLFMDGVVKELLKPPTEHDSPLNQDQSTTYLKSLGMNQQYAHAQTRLAMDGVISQITASFPTIGMNEISKCTISLTMPCDMYMDIPSHILNQRG